MIASKEKVLLHFYHEDAESDERERLISDITKLRSDIKIYKVYIQREFDIAYDHFDENKKSPAIVVYNNGQNIGHLPRRKVTLEEILDLLDVA
ncbi:hypothetical protein A4S06_09995 [Erysipelotrichaceae bacterium MTC7]|nr:hypothetical protein A4S06_09995 [Erysipelotrichaceae bacterium MTC7]